MTRDQTVRDFLRHRGAAEHVIRGGLEGLVRAWERAVRDVERGSVDIDDYLNDADGRQLLEETLAHVAAERRALVEQRVHALDERIARHLDEAGECLWGAHAAREHGWSPAREWWYFRRPARREEGT
jgi:hypothetical protein